MNKSIWSIIGYFLFWILAIYIAVQIVPYLLYLVLIAGIVFGGVILFLRYKMNKVVDNFNDTIKDTFTNGTSTNKYSSSESDMMNCDVNESQVIDVDFKEINDDKDK